MVGSPLKEGSRTVLLGTEPTWLKISYCIYLCVVSAMAHI